MKILITGGAGFIGSHLVDHWIMRSDVEEVVVIDALYTGGDYKNMPINNPKLKFYHNDLCDPYVHDIILEHLPEYVFNLAAESHVDRSIINGIPFGMSNVIGTMNLLEALKKNQKLKTFYQMSTDEVLGVRLEGQMLEGDPLTPRNPYSATKASQELICDSYRITHDFPIVILRASNQYGPRQLPEKLLPKLITNVLAGKKVPVYGKGDQIREWTYVKDTCRAIDVIVEKSNPGEIWHIGSNDERVNLDTVKEVITKLGKKPSKYIEYVPDRKAHDFRYSLNCDRLRATGWSPQYIFEEGITETIAYYKERVK
jgi:dTDP-glucose 4,6-dehydratase